MTGWPKQVVEVLIDAYKDEPCLYAINNPNYHNKHLRNEALKHISAVVSTIRPYSNEKDCSVKLHNLRNQFNTENAKVRQSIKSGIGTENVYRPNLWYYNSLKFLEEHVIPKKANHRYQIQKLL
ncbi:PREDICTED: uncharacterized protein LOC108759517 [Trachymyrmex cornetzi]|uniref:uncharacterized protein LOC108759517 n=1 Tax=Trachymyrmex cornetzi TaxID=471704 RepID=UPI00084F3370|nr:PREDICTED: uncharacterized protein LOC108759517 [Trachymyrmex cornetzi]